MFWRAYQYVSPWYAENPLARITGPLVANSTAQAVVELALRYVGYPYTWAGASPALALQAISISNLAIT